MIEWLADIEAQQWRSPAGTARGFAGQAGNGVTPSGFIYSREEIIDATKGLANVYASNQGLYNIQQLTGQFIGTDIEAYGTISIGLYGSFDVERVYTHDCMDAYRPFGDGYFHARVLHHRKHREDFAPEGHYDCLQYRHTAYGSMKVTDAVIDCFTWADENTQRLSDSGHPNPGNACFIFQSAEGPTDQGLQGIEIRRCYLAGGNYTVYFTRKDGQGYLLAAQDSIFTDIEIAFDTCRFGYTNIDATATFSEWSNVWLVDPITRERIFQLDQPGTYTRDAVRTQLGLPSVAANPAMLRPDGTTLPTSYKDMV